jgi:hypothetical protein
MTKEQECMKALQRLYLEVPSVIADDVKQKVIDALNEVKNCSIPAVVKSLPTDECVEQWWAEGQDQNEGFWQEAPYRTNGDVVEEIKIALKYFIETWQR